jgi:hypothetical protein
MALRVNASEVARSMPDGYVAMMPVKAGRTHPRQSRNDRLSLKRLSERRVRWLTDAPLAVRKMEVFAPQRVRHGKRCVLGMAVKHIVAA